MSSLQLGHVPSRCMRTAPKALSFICLSSRWTCIEMQRFSLPGFLSSSILNIVISLIALLVLWSSTKVAAAIQTRSYTDTIKVLPLLVVLLPVILATLSYSEGSRSAIRSCLTEIRWEHLFQAKNERVIKAIQTQLLCCGYNSVHDRAWPFPAQGVDATTCERNLGFTTSCGPLLKEKLLATSITSGLGGVLNFFLLVCPGKYVVVSKLVLMRIVGPCCVRHLAASGAD